MSKSRAVMWMLTSGEYSDYGVHGIYTDKAEAETAAELANRGRNSCEDEYTVEPIAILDGIMPRRADFATVSGYPLKDSETNESLGSNLLRFERQAAAPYVNYDESTGCLGIFGEREAARKAYAEHAARIKADADGTKR